MVATATHFVKSKGFGNITISDGSHSNHSVSHSNTLYFMLQGDNITLLSRDTMLYSHTHAHTTHNTH